VDGSVDVAHYQADKFLADGGSYHRIQPTLYEEIELDDTSKLDHLMDMADNVDIRPAVAWLTREFGSITS
jgi:hypothetical protein